MKCSVLRQARVWHLGTADSWSRFWHGLSAALGKSRPLRRREFIKHPMAPLNRQRAVKQSSAPAGGEAGRRGLSAAPSHLQPRTPLRRAHPHRAAAAGPRGTAGSPAGRFRAGAPWLYDRPSPQEPRDGESTDVFSAPRAGLCSCALPGRSYHQTSQLCPQQGLQTSFQMHSAIHCFAIWYHWPMKHSSVFSGF